jgi:hypothetical protein
LAKKIVQVFLFQKKTLTLYENQAKDDKKKFRRTKKRKNHFDFYFSLQINYYEEGKILLCHVQTEKKK